MRSTPVHNLILSLLNSARHPLSAVELINQIPANKTTIYRQLSTMVRQGLINEVRFTDRKIRYELSDRRHHHHLVCDGCGLIKDIPLNESVLLSQLSGVKDFQITRHSLEFFGVCKNCQPL